MLCGSAGFSTGCLVILQKDLHYNNTKIICICNLTVRFVRGPSQTLVVQLYVNLSAYILYSVITKGRQINSFLIKP